ncbi:hypothetical protein FFK22_013595 [Mycobacterium sp. KBS0706]|uniref:hypothetical protein n=1 Tax=Mycobacterium sp. KBS0706 TaxID=2578109 RepID=UPI00110FC489|nr:hypothetical protein [Mycobacterium sp. KBS0706]TSD88260.1 hypothetical protein FFK22_013595 [Mycobacterium sp. KBS0706]
MIALSATSCLIADPLSQYLRPWPDLAALISNLITGPSSQYILPWPALAALSGAYVWLLNDFIAKARYRDVAPSDLLWGAARLVACVPLGYAVGVIANKEIMPFLAFGLGAFPTDMMAKLIRRIVESQLKIDKSDEGALDPISQLQGMQRPIVERFNSEGIFSVTKLAYSDPVLLAMRTSYSFNFVVDCVSQSLVWIYLETRTAVIRQFSLRGAYEIWEFVKELDSTNIVTKSKANKRLEAIAKATQIDIVLLEFSLRKISDDEYTIFIRKIWTSVFKEEVEIKADIAPPRGQLDSWAHYREPDL